MDFRTRRGIARTLAALVVVCFTLGVPRSAASDDARAGVCGLTWGLMVTTAPWDDRMTDIRTVDTELNRHSQIVHWYAQWGDPGAGTFAANQPRLLNNVRNYASVGVTGSTPLITWEPWGPHYTANSTDFPLTSIAAGQYDGYIDSWANGLRTFGNDVLLDWGHEMNGVWYPWGAVNGNQPYQYVAAFRHIHDRFVMAGATNVKFVWNLVQWSPAGIPGGAFYPGDAYVDWLALDTYNWNSAWGSPWDVIHPIYDQATSVSPSKPVMLAEVGSEANPPAGSYPASQAAWITLLGDTLAQSFPRVRSVVWFNQLNTPFALDSSAATLSAAQNAFGNCG
jgi:beta-mannanase